MGSDATGTRRQHVLDRVEYPAQVCRPWPSAPAAGSGVRSRPIRGPSDRFADHYGDDYTAPGLRPGGLGPSHGTLHRRFQLPIGYHSARPPETLGTGSYRRPHQGAQTPQDNPRSPRRQAEKLRRPRVVLGGKQFFIHCQHRGERIWKIVGHIGTMNVKEARAAAAEMLTVIRRSENAPETRRSSSMTVTSRKPSSFAWSSNAY